MSIGTKRELETSFDDVLARLPDALKAEGFGILTEIDVKETLKKKIGVDFRRYKILGACNPPLAHEALSAETEIGLMLPCNVIIYETDAGKTVVSAVDPMATIASVGNPKLAELAKTVRDKLARVVASLPG